MGITSIWNVSGGGFDAKGMAYGLQGCTFSGDSVTAVSLCTAGPGAEKRSQTVPGPDAEALVLPRPGDGTAGTLQRSASAGIWAALETT